MDRKAGTHGFDGACAPGGYANYPGTKSFSFGVFEWLPRANGDGVKKGPVKVRVRSPISRQEEAEELAREIAAQLDAGTYHGPKNVKV